MKKTQKSGNWEKIKNNMLKFVKSNWLIILIVLLALFLRAAGEYPGFPDNQPDEGTSYRTAIYMLSHNLKPDIFAYPAGVPLLHLIVYQTFILPVMLFKVLFFHPRVIFAYMTLGNNFFLQFHDEIFGPRSIYALYWSRYIGALIGTGSVIVLYFIGKRLFNKTVGIISAFFLAVNYRHVLGSHIGLPDSHNSFFALLAFFSSLLLLEKNTRKRYILAGATAGLSFSMKYYPFAFFPFLFVHLMWTLRKRSFFYLFNKNFIFGVISSILVFLAINPYYLINIKEVLYQNSRDYGYYGMGQYFLHPYSYFYLYHWGIGHWPTFVILAGIVLMLFSAPKKLLFLLSFVLPFFFVFMYFSGGSVFSHNFINGIPFLMIFAGYLFYLLFRLIKKIPFIPSTLSLVIICILVFAVNFSSLKNSFILDYFYSQPWDITVLGKWIAKSMPANIETRNYPLYGDFDAIYKKKKIVEKMWDYNLGPNSLAEFQEEGTNFAILNTADLQAMTYWWRLWTKGSQLSKYDNVPFDFIENGFYGLALKELRDYTVHEVYKPWQAQSERAYVVFKIPPKLNNEGSKVAYFGFDNNDFWQKRGFYDETETDLGWTNEDGKTQVGALFSRVGGRSSTIRLGSPAIPVTAGKFYIVKGWIKNMPKIDSTNDLKAGYDQRAGFLRLDFYKDSNKLDQLGMSVALSQRGLYTGDWMQVEASTKAPVGSKYVTISFQRASLAIPKSITYLDDVELLESNAASEELFKSVPYIKSTIPLESLYWNSFL